MALDKSPESVDSLRSGYTESVQFPSLSLTCSLNKHPSDVHGAKIFNAPVTRPL